uniref:TSA: Wollemia nobilis Ref_Wollemi_Transcript_5240_2751 transcribed RNA sequence n=1 Tax=Wollemia nobilis TaxID=56998 RepID=A0A0C9QVS4_9CONI
MTQQLFNFKWPWQRADDLLKALIPPIHEICILDLQLPKDKRNDDIQELYKALLRGAELVKRFENISAFNLFSHFRYAIQILKLEKEIDKYMRLIPAHSLLAATRLITELRNLHLELMPADVSSRLNESIFKKASMLTNDPSQNSAMLQQMASDGLFGVDAMEEDPPPYTFNNTVSEKCQFYVGLGKSLANLKELLFQRDVSTVGVQCIGGGGKTTLALALCDDPQIKRYFGNRGFFFTVSQSPNLKAILEAMWEKIVGRKTPEFQNVEDAHRQLQEQLLRQSRPTLVILDDVWSRTNLEKLLFEGPGYKTLVTTRDSSTIPRDSSTRVYQLPFLAEDDALSLFCFWAFGETSIPSTVDANVVKEVQAQCRGLPLALKVIGSSLNGAPFVAWQSAMNKLSKGEPISDYHKEGVLRCLETSIDCLDDVAKECFLDLAAFPEDRKICADALLDIWVHVRNLEWEDAFVILLELASKNLLNLTSDSGSQPTVSYRSASELFFSQHDVIRDLALYLGAQDNIIHGKRLMMPRKEHNLPAKWKSLNEAQIVSMHTGTMDETQWLGMNFPETEALVLVFAAREYFLPPFLTSMKKLKFLMVFNYSSKRATVKGTDCLSSLSQLKSLHLQKLIVPPVIRQIKGLQKIEKLSVSLCEGFENISAFNNSNLSLKLPILKDLNLGHCSDLEELPPAICHMPYAQTLSISNCHQVQRLPYELGNLESLKLLKLSALPSLKELPKSIGKLVQLEYLDISQCECLQELPDEIGELKKLKAIDMKECSQLRKLPRSVCGLTNLEHVICNEKIAKQWMKAKGFSIPRLEVEVAEIQFSLDWLND